MKLHAYVPVYSLTLLLSAALLFSIQPMFSKMILPLLGGTPQVWNTAMLFFQVMLLGGYAYAHGTTRFLSIRAQAILHFILLGLFTVVLPIAVPEGWLPPVDKDPTLWQLSLMSVTVGGPFFVLAGSAPMLQRWFAATDHKDAHNPYFLYGASNLGSMTSLLAYPVVIEPLWNLSEQSAIWSWGYYVLMGLAALSALLVWPKGNLKEKHETHNGDAITWSLRFKWLLLAFAPSSLMLGVTTFITTDIASVPLLWILPLALYVGTFIIVFARNPIIKQKDILSIQGLLLAGLAGLMIATYIYPDIPPMLLIPIHMVLFFFCALSCHTELAALRPHSSHLTEFYLLMSLGGALGGVFNAIIAPQYFIFPLEYPLTLLLVASLRFSAQKETSLQQSLLKLSAHVKKKGIVDTALSVNFICLALIIILATGAFLTPIKAAHLVSAFVVTLSLLLLTQQRWIFLLGFAYTLMLFPPGYEWGRFFFKNVIHQDRNFFGVIKITDMTVGERILLHGTTNHGAQPLDEKLRLEPLSYYSHYSPLNDIFELLDTKAGDQKVAVLGLGIGVTSCFGNERRKFDFFEIDKDIVDIAENPEMFTYLSDCGTDYDIILGDGRMKIADKPEGSYDLILLDAFSSDNIPVHLMTLEAVKMYLTKLKPDGVLVFHISNHFLDLEPVLAKIGLEVSINPYARYTPGGELEGTEMRGYPAHFLVFSPTQENINFLTAKEWSEARFRPGVKPWSDQFSNIVSVLGNQTGLARHKEILAKEKEQKEEGANLKGE
ncbi:MAG TPA: hypothetical protein DEA55_06395 [Rhodospirillaceae bacterium]|nr:hypothetical protein [Rhodospirillaceae bacterium]